MLNLPWGQGPAWTTFIPTVEGGGASSKVECYWLGRIFTLVGLKGHLSLLEIFIFASGLRQINACFVVWGL